MYLRLLSPIREYILSSICLRPSGELKDKIITCFSELLADGWSPSDSDSWHLVRPEISNLHNLLAEALRHGPMSPELATAVVNYTQWCFYIGINDETVLNLALAFDSPDSPNIDWGDCYRAKGELLQEQGAMADAEKAFQRSVELSRQAQDAIC